MDAIKYQPTYLKSYALVIGVDEYVHLPPLQAAKRGAAALKDILVRQYGFEVTLLKDNEVTRESVLSWLEALARNVQIDDRVLIYFAGHGSTRGEGFEQRGYLALTNSVSDQWLTALPIDDVIDESKHLRSKHLIFMLDSCFSGLALETRAAPDIPRELQYYLMRPVRYAISAGGKEVVDDNAGPNGEFSLFTYHLLNWLTESKSVPPDGIWRSRELGNYLERVVASDRRSGHKPNHSYLPGSGDGDFIFRWDTKDRLPLEVEAAVRSDNELIRMRAVDMLGDLVQQKDSNLAALATQRLRKMVDADKDEKIRTYALHILQQQDHSEPTRLIRSVNIESALSGKITPVEEMADNVTARQLAEAFKTEIGLPENEAIFFVRRLTGERLPPDKTMREIGIFNNEVLVADIDYTSDFQRPSRRQ